MKQKSQVDSGDIYPSKVSLDLETKEEKKLNEMSFEFF
jgi:hypothetical protein